MEANVVSGLRDRYVPALHFRWLTPFYDRVLRWAFQEGQLKARLVELAGLRPGLRALDVGCGTGTLTLLLQRSEPAAEVVGVDGDEDVLDIARRKARNDRGTIRWDLGTAYELPYDDEAFDVVVASLMLHHLSRERRGRALREMHRVLRAGGLFLAADFGPSRTRLLRALAKAGELLEDTEDGVEGRLPSMFVGAGFESVETLDAFGTPLGTIWLYRARRPWGQGP